MRQVLFNSVPDSMLSILTNLDARYGNIADYGTMCEHLKAHASMLETRAAIRGEHPTAHKTKRAPGAAVTSTDVVDGSTNGPKWDKTCHNCNKVGHIARFCPALSSKERKALQEKYAAKRKGNGYTQKIHFGVSLT